jgi:hypothetical protein
MKQLTIEIYRFLKGEKMLELLKSVVLVGLVCLSSIANAEFRPSEHDGFQRPKPKKSFDQKTNSDDHHDTINKKKDHLHDHDGIKKPKKSNPNSSATDKKPSKDEVENVDHHDGIKRPKKEN